MCRWTGWLGQPVLVDEPLFKTQHGIVGKSPDSRLGAETTPPFVPQATQRVTVTQRDSSAVFSA